MSADEKITTEVVAVAATERGLEATMRVLAPGEIPRPMPITDPVAVRMLASVGTLRTGRVVTLGLERAAPLVERRFAAFVKPLEASLEAQPGEVVTDGETSEVRDKPRRHARVRNGAGRAPGRLDEQAGGEPGQGTDAG